MIAMACVPDEISERQDVWTFVNDCADDVVLRWSFDGDETPEELIEGAVGKRIEKSGGELAVRGFPGGNEAVVIFGVDDDVLAEISIAGSKMFSLGGNPCRLVDE